MDDLTLILVGLLINAFSDIVALLQCLFGSEPCVLPAFTGVSINCLQQVGIYS